MLETSGDAAWSGEAHNRWMPLLLVGVLGQGAVVALLIGSAQRPALNAAHLLLLVVLELFAKVRVRVDARELRIIFGYTGWLRRRLALERVVAASAFTLEPLGHGGWGYRGSVRLFKRAALVVRAGPALALTLQGGGRLSITVDDAEEGARVINALLARRSPGEPQDAAALAAGPG
jgi:hypothetical protein